MGSAPVDFQRCKKASAKAHSVKTNIDKVPAESMTILQKEFQEMQERLLCLDEEMFSLEEMVEIFFQVTKVRSQIQEN